MQNIWETNFFRFIHLENFNCKSVKLIKYFNFIAQVFQVTKLTVLKSAVDSTHTHTHRQTHTTYIVFVELHENENENIQTKWFELMIKCAVSCLNHLFHLMNPSTQFCDAHDEYNISNQSIVIISIKEKEKENEKSFPSP